MIALGIDPDSTDTAFAWWDENGPVTAEVAHVIQRKGVERSLMRTAHAIKHTSSTPGVEIVAIEGQQRDGRKTGRNTLFTLAQVAGIAIAFAADRYPNARLLVPPPAEWKGGVAKHAHQARLYEWLGWGYDIRGGKSRYAVPVSPPTSFNHIKPGQWKHVGDALLLAKWAFEQA